LTAAPPALPPLREVIATHGLRASKALGQNFLLDEQLLDRIAAVPGALTGAPVFEVGPGPGGLTRACLRAGARVTAVERDARCIPALAEVASAFPGQLTVIEGDAMAIGMPDTGGAHYHIVANLPYNVGTALLVRWLEETPWPPRWASATLMFQAEVAERIVAGVNTSAYGRLAVLSQWRSTARIAMKVHRSAFTPPPKVMSAVVHIVPGDAPKDVDPAILSAITAAAFGQRRKMLRQSMKSVNGGLNALAACGIDPTLRAENLPVADFVAIARALGQLRGAASSD
jgi:16S rRNA (adenine1518-N6/adenine1519-N6)-dimethyltransferase